MTQPRAFLRRFRRRLNAWETCDVIERRPIRMGLRQTKI